MRPGNVEYDVARAGESVGVGSALEVAPRPGGLDREDDPVDDTGVGFPRQGAAAEVVEITGLGEMEGDAVQVEWSIRRLVRIARSCPTQRCSHHHQQQE